MFSVCLRVPASLCISTLVDVRRACRAEESCARVRVFACVRACRAGAGYAWLGLAGAGWDWGRLAGTGVGLLGWLGWLGRLGWLGWLGWTGWAGLGWAGLVLLGNKPSSLHSSRA